MRIMIGGDISINDSAELFAQKRTREAFGDLIEEFAKADEVIVNLECAITESEGEIKKFGPCLKGPFGTGDTLKEAGVTLCALSNNHIFDFGKKGLSDTLAELDRVGLPYTGIGETEEASRVNYILNDGKTKVAIVNVCEHEYSYALPDRVGARPYDPYDTNDDIVAAKKNADFVVVIYHGGKEHVRYPSPRLVKACRSMVKHGADVVLCQHSHCIGCYEKFEGGHILYGQGNFHFVKEASSKTDEAKARWNNGFLVDLTFADQAEISFVPTVVDGLGIRLANAEEKAAILSDFAQRNAELADGTWREKWHAYCESLKYYQFISEDRKDTFSHYLDCEAHTDVWREVYPTWNHTNEK